MNRLDQKAGPTYLLPLRNLPAKSTVNRGQKGAKGFKQMERGIKQKSLFQQQAKMASSIITGKEGHVTIMKGTVHQEEITILNMYLHWT